MWIAAGVTCGMCESWVCMNRYLHTVTLEPTFTLQVLYIPTWPTKANKYVVAELVIYKRGIWETIYIGLSECMPRHILQPVANISYNSNIWKYFAGHEVVSEKTFSPNTSLLNTLIDCQDTNCKHELSLYSLLRNVTPETLCSISIVWMKEIACNNGYRQR